MPTLNLFNFGPNSINLSSLFNRNNDSNNNQNIENNGDQKIISPVADTPNSTAATSNATTTSNNNNNNNNTGSSRSGNSGLLGSVLTGRKMAFNITIIGIAAYFAYSKLNQDNSCTNNSTITSQSLEFLKNIHETSCAIVYSLAPNLLLSSCATIPTLPKVDAINNSSGSCSSAEPITIDSKNPEAYPFIDTTVLPLGHYPMRLIHTNDVHAHYDQFGPGGGDCSEEEIAAGKCYGGAPRLKYVVDQLRAAADSDRHKSLLVDAGDQFQGTMFFNYYYGKAGSQVLNTLGYEAMTLGNHEFDEGLNVLSEFVALLQFPMVSANVDIEFEELASQLVPYSIIKRHNLALIGVTTPETAELARNTTFVTFNNPVPIINRLAKEIKEKHGINRIIVLSHMGYQADIDLAKTLDPGVSLIIGGHSHSYLSPDPENDPEKSEGRYPTIIENNTDKSWRTFVVQSKKWGEYVGYLDLVFDPNGALTDLTGGKPIRLTQDIPQDPVIRKMIDDLRRPFDEEGRRVVGIASDDFKELSRLLNSEMPIGHMTSDAYVELCDNNPDVYSESSIVAGIFNSGGVRSGLYKGNVTVNDAIAIMPFSSLVAAVNITGEQLIKSVGQVLRDNTSIRPDSGLVASTLQLAGLKASFKVDQDTGKNVLEQLLIKNSNTTWTPVDMSKQYTIATFDFLAEGKDNMFYKDEVYKLPEYVVCGKPASAIIEHISRNSPISVKDYSNNRIILVS
ncbi:hypothetical protein H4219_002490 [Mycoemilia scoparia]|uniref:5'-nucleotidase n=1 Tax=Mycoemilia scoparia TaxID=417184 RepID=A0A9W7ZXE2_9FUNG|nr:hypothetical protein H4219_002490 [Mycoemilia scoparia]